MTGRTRKLCAELAASPAEPLQAAAEAEALRRLERFLHGVAQYRSHPYRRDLPEPPAIWAEGGTRLLDYAPGGGKPVLVVPSLVNRATILDLTAERSLLRHMAARGMRPLLVDWGAPGPLETGFTLGHYIARLVRALAFAHRRMGVKIGLAGYCMGGLLALPLAQRQAEMISNLALIATPWDFHAAHPGIGATIRALRPQIDAGLLAAGELPVDVLQSLFLMLAPSQVGRKFRAFAGMNPKTQKARIFVAAEDWLNDGVPLVADVARQTLFGWYGDNAPALGEWRVDNRKVRPQELDLPVALFIASRDGLVPPPSALALADVIPKARRYLLATGHIGMMAGRRARGEFYTPLTNWLNRW